MLVYVLTYVFVQQHGGRVSSFERNGDIKLINPSKNNLTPDTYVEAQSVLRSR